MRPARPLTALALAFAASIASASSAEAQNPDRLRAGVSVGAQVGSQTVGQVFETTVYREASPIRNEIDLSGGTILDVGASYRLAGSVWAGVAFSSLSRTAAGALDAKLPHPFYFNQPRLVEGTVEDLQSAESAVHLSVSYLLRLSEALDVSVFGGPTRFMIEQDLVTDIAYNEAYPFDAASFTSATRTTASDTAWGFNTGVDVTWRFSRALGVGGLIRFAKASTTLTASPGNAVSTDAGGLVAGGGLRVMF